MNKAQKAETFRALHAAPASFVIASAWDAGSAKLLRGLGFPALATSSSAQASILGRVGGAVIGICGTSDRERAAKIVGRTLRVELV